MNIKFTLGELTKEQQEVITTGFQRHSDSLSAPPFAKARINWLAYDSASEIVGALTANLFWDWLYIDELWTDEYYRGKGVGRQLMEIAESYAINENLIGVYLWTQSWQAGGFYEHIGYKKFTEFEDFPRGHKRIGYRKQLS